MSTGPELWQRVQATYDTVLNCKGCNFYLFMSWKADRVWLGAIYLSERSATPRSKHDV